MTDEGFFYDIATNNHHFLKPASPLVFGSDPKTKQDQWLLYSGLLETWKIVFE